MRYTIVLDPDPEGGFTLTVPAIPTIVTQGETEEDARANAADAIALALRVAARRGEPAPVETGENLFVSVRERERHLDRSPMLENTSAHKLEQVAGIHRRASSSVNVPGMHATPDEQLRSARQAITSACRRAFGVHGSWRSESTSSGLRLRHAPPRGRLSRFTPRASAV